METWLTSVSTPVFLLNAKRKVLFFNHGCERLTDWSAEDVVGEVCEYVTDPDATKVTSVTSCLCPPTDVLNGEIAEVPVYFTKRDGTSHARLVHFFPMQDAEGTVESMAGIVTELRKPVQHHDVSPAQKLHAELAALRINLRQRYSINSIVAVSPAMLRVLEQVNLSRQSTSPVLLQGENGVGREHVARVIHYESDHANRLFVPLECHTLPSDQLEGALQRLFETEWDEKSAMPTLRPGTLFLNRIDQLSLDLQAMLVDHFQVESEFRSPLRLIASTSCDLQKLTESDEFRRDLYYSLTSLRIDVPTLNERREELVLLAQSFLEKLNRGADRQVTGFTEDTLNRFQAYAWPGNISELHSVIRESYEASTSDMIDVDHLPFRFWTGLDAQAEGPPVRSRVGNLAEYMERVEREHIQAALNEARQNKTKAAQMLGMPRAKLYRRMESLGLEDVDG